MVDLIRMNILLNKSDEIVFNQFALVAKFWNDIKLTLNLFILFNLI